MTTLRLPFAISSEARPTAAVRSRTRDIRVDAVTGLCVFSALLGRLIYILRPFDSDSSMFIYMGKLAVDGHSLCRDFIDNKLPSVGLMISLPWRLFGTAWPPYVVLQSALSLATVLILIRIARRHAGPDAAIATGLFALVYLNLNTIVFGGFQLETPQTFFAAIAAMAAIEALVAAGTRDAFLLGLAAGTAALYKPTGLAVMAAFIACVIARAIRRDWSLSQAAHLIVSAAIGALIPAIVAAIYMTACGDWPYIAGRLSQIASYSRNSAWSTGDWFKPVIAAMFPAFPLLVRWRVFRAPERRTGQHAAKITVAFLLTWLALEIFGVAAQRRMYAYHFMPLVPAVALLFGMIPRKAQAGPLLAALLPAILFSAAGAAGTFEASYHWPQRLAATDFLAAHATANDAVWQDDAARLLLETNLRPGSRVLLTFLFGNDDAAPLTFGGDILSDLRQRHPRWIILPNRLDGFLDRYVAGSVELDRNPERAKNFRLAWLDIRAFTLSRYRAVCPVGPGTIYERIDPPNAAR